MQRSYCIVCVYVLKKILFIWVDIIHFYNVYLVLHWRHIFKLVYQQLFSRTLCSNVYERQYNKNNVRTSWIAYSVSLSIYIYISRTYILIRNSHLFQCFPIHSVNVTNNVCFNKGVYLYLVGISFLEQTIFSFYLFLKSWHFSGTRFGQNSEAVLIFC